MNGSVVQTQLLWKFSISFFPLLFLLFAIN